MRRGFWKWLRKALISVFWCSSGWGSYLFSSWFSSSAAFSTFFSAPRPVAFFGFYFWWRLSFSSALDGYGLFDVLLFDAFALALQEFCFLLSQFLTRSLLLSQLESSPATLSLLSPSLLVLFPTVFQGFLAVLFICVFDQS